MDIGRTHNAKKLQRAEVDFKQAVQLTRSVFGDKAFRKFKAGDDDDKNGDWERRRVLAVADVQLWGFTKFKKNVVMAKADAIWEGAVELMSDADFTDVVTSNTSASSRVERRFRMWKDMLDEVIGESAGGPRLFDRKMKEQFFASDATCTICNQAIRLIDDAQVDHVEAYATGGATVAENAALTIGFVIKAKAQSSFREREIG